MSDKCSICLETLNDNASRAVLPCGHAFHGQCLCTHLFVNHQSCPLCRHSNTDVKADDESDNELPIGRRQITQAWNNLIRRHRRAPSRTARLYFKWADVSRQRRMEAQAIERKYKHIYDKVEKSKRAYRKSNYKRKQYRNQLCREHNLLGLYESDLSSL